VLIFKKKIVFGSKRVEEKFKHYEKQRQILLDISKTDAEEEKRRSNKSLQFLNAVLFATEENAKSIKQCVTSKAKSRRSDTIHMVIILKTLTHQSHQRLLRRSW
jgi:hypothetical protein